MFETPQGNTPNGYAYPKDERETPSEISTLPQRKLFSLSKKEKEKLKRERKKKNLCKTTVKLPKKQMKENLLKQKIEIQEEETDRGNNDVNANESFLQNMYNCLIDIKSSLQNSFKHFDDLISLINTEINKKENNKNKQPENGNLHNNMGNINLMNYTEQKINNNNYNINNNFINQKRKKDETITIDE